MGELYQRQTNTFWPIFYFSTSGEGDRVASLSFVTINTAIDVSSMSLEAVIATYRMWGPANGSTFSLANNASLPIFVCYKRRGGQGKVALLCNCDHGD